MSKKKITKKQTIAPTTSKMESNDSASKLERANLKKAAATPTDMLFNKKTYTYILGGIGLMLIGFFLMAGGYNEDPNVFDEDVIYSTRRTLIAPIFILAGLVVQVLAIFKK